MSLCWCIAEARAPEYGRITVPLLIIAGGDDQTAPRAGCEAIMEKYGTAKEKKRIEELPNVGHWHCIEAGDQVAELVLKFVQDV